MSRADLFADVRKDAPGGILLDAHVPLINAVADAFGLPSGANDWVQTDLSIPEFADAAVAQIRAVFEVEASGAGWSTDMRGDILALPRRPSRRIVSAQDPVRGHAFDKETISRFRASPPSLSSARWNKPLYVGGQGGYERLHRAI